MSDKSIDFLMIGVFIGIIISTLLFVTVVPGLNYLPVGSEVSHPTVEKWKAKGWQDNKGKIFENSSDALKYLQAEANSKERELD